MMIMQYDATMLPGNHSEMGWNGLFLAFIHLQKMYKSIISFLFHINNIHIHKTWDIYD